MTGLSDGSSSIGRHDIPRMQDRSLQWAFVGRLKQDRRTMVDAFSFALNESYHISYDSPPAEIWDVYRNAKFVPNGRGNVILDCFRLYEASLAGAVPVVVRSWSEIRVTFYYGGDIPQH